MTQERRCAHCYGPLPRHYHPCADQQVAPAAVVTTEADYRPSGVDRLIRFKGEAEE